MADLAGLVVYLAAWVFVGDLWVTRALDDFIRAYERQHRVTVESRKDHTLYFEGWKFLAGRVEPGHPWSTLQTDPGLEGLRQRWLARRRVNFLGPLTVVLLVLANGFGSSELATILPFGLAAVLASYFVRQILPSRSFGRKDERDLNAAVVPSGTAPIPYTKTDASETSDHRRRRWRREFVIALVAIPVLAALISAALWFSMRF